MDPIGFVAIHTIIEEHSRMGVTFFATDKIRTDGRFLRYSITRPRPASAARFCLGHPYSKSVVCHPDPSLA